jgi:Fic family protein
MTINNLEDLFEINTIILVNGWINEFSQVGLRQQPVYAQSKVIESDREYVLTFCHHEVVPELTQDCLLRLKFNLRNLENRAELPRVIAMFFFEFVFVIHPFMNGNGRTAKFIIDQILRDHDRFIPSYILMDKYALTGNLESDYKTFCEIVQKSIA